MSDLMDLAVVDPVVREAQSLGQQYATFTVTDAATFQQADELLGLLKQRIDRLHGIFDPICETAYRAHRQATAKRAEFIDPLETLKTSVSRSAEQWYREQERLRQAEERRLQEEARKAEEAARLAAAAEVERQGDAVLAQAMVEDAVTASAPAVVLPKTTPRTEHASFGEQRYGARVTDLRQLVKAVADGVVPVVAIEANMTYLNNRARLERTLLAIPGVQAVPVPTARVRS